MTLLLMAAGRGSRYGKLKQFDGLGPKEEFLMEFSIYDALENGFNHIVVITQKDNVDFLKEYLSSRIPEDIQLDVLAQELSDLPSGSTYKGERQKPWGTAHAVWTARNHIKTAFAIINADDYYGKAAYSNAINFMTSDESKEVYGLMAYTLKDTLSEFGSVSRGVCEQNENKLVSVVERTQIEFVKDQLQDTNSGLLFDGNELVSMNFWICSPSVFDYIEKDFADFLTKAENIQNGEIYIPFVIQKVLEKKKIEVDVIPSDSIWFGITYADDKAKGVNELQRLTASGDYPTPLW